MPNTYNAQMSDWSTKLHQVLATPSRLTPMEAIGKIADLAFEVGEDEGNAFLDGHLELFDHYPLLNKLYYQHIVDMETQEAQHILSTTGSGGRSFKDLAGERGIVSYERVGDMFNHVDFTDCETFVMVGCGQLPVTALHVMDRSSVKSVVCLDVSEKAISVANQLKAVLGLDKMHARVLNGRDYDFRAASVIYIGNMVSPKLEVVRQALRTCGPSARLVVREPYSLGRLWTERVEDALTEVAHVTGKGPVSRHLSRDVYLQKRTAVH
jgi:SAM-dependent methyltransferase